MRSLVYRASRRLAEKLAEAEKTGLKACVPVPRHGSMKHRGLTLSQCDYTTLGARIIVKLSEGSSNLSISDLSTLAHSKVHSAYPRIFQELLFP